MAIVIKETEYHQLNRYNYYEVEEADVIQAFGSLEAFYAKVAEDSGDVYDFISRYECDSEDDCWTMNTGGYETSIEVASEGEVEDEQ